jgi:hypothetical protein
MRYPIVLSLLTLCFSATAQDSFTKGYVILRSGDTLNGYVKSETDSKLATGVQFRKNANDTSQKLTHRLISEFGFTDGNIYKAITYADALDGNKEKTAFAKFLVEGKNSLYAVAKDEAYNYYLTTQNDSSYFLYDDVIRSTGLDKRGNFRGILYFIATNCPAVQRRAENLSFREQEVINFVREVNACMGDKQSVVHYKKVKSITHFLLYGGGMAYTNWSNITAQGQMRIVSPAISKRMSLVIGFYYAHIVETAFSYRTFSNGQYKTDILSLPFQFQYNFTDTKFQPLAYCGFSLAYKKNKNPDLYNPEGILKNYGLALIGGIGIEYFPIRQFAIKADWRYELLMHPPTIGIAFKFK